MDEQAMAREKFEKDFDNAVFRSTSKEVFEFLREQEKTYYSLCRHLFL